MRITRSARSAVVALAAVIIPSGIAIAAIQSTDSPPLTSASRAEAVSYLKAAHAASAEVDESLVAKFSVLSKPAARVSSMGEASEHTSWADTTRAHELDPAENAAKFASEWQAWVAPGATAGEICLLVLRSPAVGAGGGCDDLTTAANGTFVVTAGNADEGEVQLLGVMPDGVDHVVLTLKNGTEMRLPVVDNAYRADVTSATKSVTFTLPGEREPTTIDALAYSG